MAVVSMLRTKFCPHCGEPYLVNDDPIYNPLGLLPQKRRCLKCQKTIKPDFLGLGDAAGMVKHTKKTLEKIKKVAEWLES